MPSAPGTTVGCPSPQLGPACPWLIWLGTGAQKKDTCPASKWKTSLIVKKLSWQQGREGDNVQLSPIPV